MKFVNAGVLNVAYVEEGAFDASPVILLHGFPYDIHSYDNVIPLLVTKGFRVIVPYLRGYGPTRFLSKDTMRSGQQAALGYDLLSFMDALGIENVVLGGYDWGGRAACIVAALWPGRVKGLVSCGGYNIQDIQGAMEPLAPGDEFRYWYQYYFHGERGKIGLEKNRHELCKLLWQLWSPRQFDDQAYEKTVCSFENPDFVEVVIHSYRHRYGLVPGDPDLEQIEQSLVEQPTIMVPSIVLDGGGDGVMPKEGSEDHGRFFKDLYERRVIPNAGHNLPGEAPEDFAKAVLSF